MIAAKKISMDAAMPAALQNSENKRGNKALCLEGIWGQFDHTGY